MFESDLLHRGENLSEGEVGKVHYIPHHAVIRRDKLTTKLRVVYDASAKSDGVALNDCLYAGPPLAENIFDVLLRFRVNQVALTGDIEKAFLMVGKQRKIEMCYDSCGWMTLTTLLQRLWF